MNRIVIIILLLTWPLISIGNCDLKLPKVDPHVKSLVVKFNDYYKRFRHSCIADTIVVEFTDILSSIKANGRYSRATDVTTISSKKWPTLSKIQKETVVFHELGHHILKRSHDWTKYRIMDDGCPRSMMYYQGVSDICYKRYRKYYLRELFHWSH